MNNTRQTHNHGQADGFTLLEVVVALAILGTSLVLLLETHYASLSLFANAQEHATLSFLGERVVGIAENEIMAGKESGEGDFGPRYAGYTYSFSSSQVSEGEMPGLYEVTVTVRGPSSERDLVFFTYNGALQEESTVGQ